MNEQAILHIPDSKYCFATGPKQVVLRLRVAKEDIFEKIEVVYACKYEIMSVRYSQVMEKKYTDRLFDFYEITLNVEDVRLAYIFKLYENGKEYYFSEDGITETYDYSLGFYNFFQLPYINMNDVHQTVEWVKSAVFYQVFVDRFKMGIKDKDTSYINLKWGEKPNPKSFAGGDIPGITEKLDYICSLGANALYVTPLFQSVSNHKYDTIDYMEIDPHFGTAKDLKDLIEGCHKRGMKIVLDAVFNHCSMLTKQFQDVLKKGHASEYYQWFLIDGEYPDPGKMNYECFASCNYMPKLNTANPAVQKFLLQIGEYYIREYDIDGWRLDVSDEISHEFWRKFRSMVKKCKPDCVIIGENWHDANTYLHGDQYDSIMNYAFTKACLDYFAFDAFDAKHFSEKLNELLMRNTKQVNEMMMNLLDSHDTHRFFSEVSCDKDKVLAALAVTFMYLGAPCIYYGTELHMEGGYDPDCRRCFDWDAVGKDKDYFDTIHQITALKKQPEVIEGDISITDKQGLFVLTRTLKKQEIILIINETDKEAQMNTEELIPESVLAENRFTGKSLLPGGFVVYRQDLV